MSMPTVLAVRRSRSLQGGLSLIELLVGITIGLLVVVAAVGSLVYTRTSSQSVGDSSRLQQDATNAFRILGHQIRQGGARRLVNVANGDTNVNFNEKYLAFGANPITGSTIVVQGTDGLGAAPDTLQVSFDTDPILQSMDCMGQPTLNQNNISSRFSVANNELRCLGSGSTQEFAFLQGVEDFQVLYGFRVGDTLQYRTATDINTVPPNPGDKIVAVQICLRLAGELANYPSTEVTGCQNEKVAGDGRIRKVFVRVFSLRNQNP